MDGISPAAGSPSRLPATLHASGRLATCIPNRSGRTGRRKGALERCTTCRNAAPRSRPTASPKETLHFPLQFRKRGFHRFPPRIDNDRPLWTQTFEMQARSLADTPPDAVAHHRLAERAGQGEADPRPAGLRFAQTESRKKGPRKAGTAVIYSAEIRGSQQTNTFRETRDALPLGADRKLVAAPSATPRQNGPPVLGCHAGAEPVCFRAPTIIWLKGTFRHFTPSYSV